MEQQNQATAAADAAVTVNSQSATPTKLTPPIDNLTGPVPDEKPVNAPAWMKPCSKRCPKKSRSRPSWAKNETSFTPVWVATHRITMDHVQKHQVHARAPQKIAVRSRASPALHNDKFYYDEHDKDLEERAKINPLSILPTAWNFRLHVVTWFEKTDA